MITVNLIGRKRKQVKGKNWSLIASFSLFGALVLYFIGSTLYVVISFAIVNNKLADTKREIETVSAQILKDNDSLNKYVLAKFILQKITVENKSKFKYKTYLDQIASSLPAGSDIKSVDFTVKGWVKSTVAVSDINAFKRFEDSVGNSTFWKGSQYFSTVIVENISKDTKGLYSVKLHFELKKDNG